MQTLQRTTLDNIDASSFDPLAIPIEFQLQTQPSSSETHLPLSDEELTSLGEEPLFSGRKDGHVIDPVAGSSTEPQRPSGVTESGLMVSEVSLSSSPPLITKIHAHCVSRSSISR
jgi:hypothetical protein